MEKIFQKPKIKILVSLFFALFILWPSFSDAATLFFSPSSNSYQVGANFSVNLYVSSLDQTMNAASGIISFPSDKLEIISLSKTDSIFSLWVQEPSFSNPLGQIQFEGIVLNPGFTGDLGKILTVTFKVKIAGAAKLNFSSGAVLANDGKGTNILTGLGAANFSLGVIELEVPKAAKPIAPPQITQIPLAPEIESLTHPDPLKWYNLKEAKFSWKLPADVSALRVLIDKLPQTVPTVSYAPAIDSKEVSDLDDDVWYFHLRFKNSRGWGPISHFKFQIDTQPPEPFEIKFIEGESITNPRPTVIFNTLDYLSGLDYYKVKIGEGDDFIVSEEKVKSNPYILPYQAPGKRTLLVAAYDKAGNYTLDSKEFIIEPLVAPVITEYPKELGVGEILLIKGISQYPNGQIIVFSQKEKEEPQSQVVGTNQNGDFVLALEKGLTKGIYKIWAEATDEKGAKGNPSNEITITVKPMAFLKMGWLVINYLTIVIVLIACLLLLILLIGYGWRKFFELRKRLRKEVKEAEITLTKAFKLLKEDIEEQIKILEKIRAKRSLTKEEEEIISRFKEDLDEAEKLISKEIKDIKKEVK